MFVRFHRKLFGGGCGPPNVVHYCNNNSWRKQYDASYCSKFTTFDRATNAQQAVDWILAELTINKIHAEQTQIGHLLDRVKSLHTNYKTKWEQSSRQQKRFEVKNKLWLDHEFQVTENFLHVSLNPCTSNKREGDSGETELPQKRGRPPLSFYAKGTRARQLDANALMGRLEGEEPSAIVAAAALGAQRSGERSLASVLQEVVRTPTRSEKVRRKLKFTPTAQERFSDTEAVALILDMSLSVGQYNALRSAFNLKKCDVLPAYHKVLQLKKKNRPRPETFVLTETMAQVELQELLNLTASRICKLAEDVIHRVVEERRKKTCYATLNCSWGFDGSSGQSQFKQKFQEDNKSDQALFATTMIPLRLVTDDGEIPWSNQTPQSVRYCRPIKLEYIKETADHIRKEKQAMDMEISVLKPLEMFLAKVKVVIYFSLSMTLIDGKVLNIITDTPSMQCCPICKASPKQFNDLSNIDTGVFDPEPESLKYGISPLHAWIRVMECVLKISYRLEVKQWKTSKVLIEPRKQLIKDELWKKLGLKVDRPKSQGSGSTNDGNTARRIFQHAKEFCEITGFDQNFMRNLQTILIALSCQLPIDPVLFGEYCTTTAQKYIELYNWYKMPSTVHKILVHGKQIICNSILPVGMLGEEASEANNKVYKKFRLLHARTHNREDNLRDLYERVYDSSDPIYSSVSLDKRRRKQKRSPLPDSVRVLLAPAIESNSDDEEEQDESVEDATGLPETLLYLDELALSEVEEDQN